MMYRLLLLPYNLITGNFDALKEIKGRPRVRFSQTGTMQTNRPQNLICEIKFGSHLYGTATETSDRDFKGIFLPTTEEIYLGRIPKTKASTPSNGKKAADELDCEYYSLHHFVKLASQGQTVAMDMLFAPETCVFKSVEYGWVWDEIVKNRHLFLSKRMSAFIGYARSQASKYSLKGDRYNRLIEFRDVLYLMLPEARMSTDWERLVSLADEERKNPHGLLELRVGAKWFGETTRVSDVHKAVSNLVDKYGNRAQQAADMGGADWKAMSHAVRVSKELIELVSLGSIHFPLADAPLILRIKKGELTLEQVGNILDGDLLFIEAQMKQSRLPETVDVQFWDTWLCQVVQTYLQSFWPVNKINILGEWND